MNLFQNYARQHEVIGELARTRTTEMQVIVEGIDSLDSGDPSKEALQPIRQRLLVAIQQGKQFSQTLMAP